jgi:hypothetical protein
VAFSWFEPAAWQVDASSRRRCHVAVRYYWAPFQGASASVSLACQGPAFATFPLQLANVSVRLSDGQHFRRQVHPHPLSRDARQRSSSWVCDWCLASHPADAPPKKPARFRCVRKCDFKLCRRCLHKHCYPIKGGRVVISAIKCSGLAPRPSKFGRGAGAGNVLCVVEVDGFAQRTVVVSGKGSRDPEWALSMEFALGEEAQGKLRSEDAEETALGDVVGEVSLSLMDDQGGTLRPLGAVTVPVLKAPPVQERYLPTHSRPFAPREPCDLTADCWADGFRRGPAGLVSTPTEPRCSSLSPYTISG